MLKGFAASEALIDIDAHESADKILGGIANIIPVRRVKLEFTYKKKKGSIPFCTMHKIDKASHVKFLIRSIDNAAYEYFKKKIYVPFRICAKRLASLSS